jgi:hypothetical protein
MMSEGIRRRNLRADEDGDARLTSGFVTAGVLTFIMLAVVLFTETPVIGPNEGELAPNLVGEVHMSGSSTWVDFELYDEIDFGWTNDSDPNAKWFLIIFMDTDCGHCWVKAEEMSLIHDTFGDQVNIISVAVSLNMQNHESSREEVVAFQDKIALNGCNGGSTDCSSRDGGVHNWTYFDDLRSDYMDTWGVQGTPSYTIIQPDGTVAWNQAQHQDVEVGQALFTLLPIPGE